MTAHSIVETLEGRTLFAIIAGAPDPFPGISSSSQPSGTTAIDLPANASTSPVVLLPQSSDGGVIAVGNSSALGPAGGVYLTRLNSGGVPYPNFGVGGVVTKQLSTLSANVLGAGQSSNGAITILLDVTSKLKRSNAGVVNSVLLRFNLDGSLDTHFGKTGEVVISSAMLDTYFNQSIAVAENGAITVGGEYSPPAKPAKNPGKVLATLVVLPSSKPSSFELLRYTAAGKLDHTFGKGGIVRRQIGLTDTPSSMAVDADGSLAMAGTVSFSNGGLEEAILRYDSKGHPDVLFGSKGAILQGAITQGAQIAFGQANDILVADVRNDEVEVADFSAFGQLNSYFGNRGISDIAPADSTLNLYGTIAGIKTNGNVITLMAGASQVTTAETIQYSAMLVRLNADGSPNTQFAAAGQITTADNTQSPSAFAATYSDIYVGQSVPGASGNTQLGITTIYAPPNGEITLPL